MSNLTLHREPPIISLRVTRTDQEALQNFFLNVLIDVFSEVKLVKCPLFRCSGIPTDPDELYGNGWGWGIYIDKLAGVGRTPYYALKDAYFRRIVKRNKLLFWEQVKAYQKGIAYEYQKNRYKSL